MHILIGFGIVVGLIAFAFGSNVAQSFVRAVMTLFGLALFGIAIWFAVVAWDELRPAHVAKSKSATGYAIDTYTPPKPRIPELAVPDIITSEPPGDEPRCGYACEVSHSDLPKSCWEWMDLGTPQSQLCKIELK